jgi:hypothetical protein
VRITVDVKGTVLTVALPADAPQVAAGDLVALSWRTEAAHALEAS